LIWINPYINTFSYHPADTRLIENFNLNEGGSWGNQSPDSISVPIIPKGSSIENSVSIDVDLDPGLPLHLIDSPYHNITKQKNSSGKHLISLKNYQISNKDFELHWQVTESVKPRIALFREQVADDEYLLLMITPPDFPI